MFMYVQFIAFPMFFYILKKSSDLILYMRISTHFTTLKTAEWKEN